MVRPGYVIVCLTLYFTRGFSAIQEIQDGPAGCELPESFPDGTALPYDTSELEITPDNKQWLLPNSMLVFNCRDGYKLVGDKSIMCEGQGQWESQFPTCYRKYCVAPPEPSPGGQWAGRSRLPNRSVVLRCLKGYRLENPQDRKLVCQRVNQTELDWIGTMPNCEKMAECEDPGQSTNGTRDPIESTVFYSGSQVSFECDPNHDLVGSESIQCGEDGLWSAPKPRCKPSSTCPDLPEDPNGRFIVTAPASDYFVPGNQVDLQCHAGFRPSPLFGSFMIFCDDTETWDEDIAVCQPITCTPPNLKSNSFIDEEDKDRTEYPYNAEIRIHCRSGFVLRGINWNVCTDHGWQHQMPSCNELRCRDPGVLENGRRQGSSTRFLVNSTVNYFCRDGYVLTGSSTRTCMTNGQWDGALTACTLANTDGCQNPGTPMNGNRFGNTFEIGDRVRFSCDPGFFLLGSHERICGSNRVWTGEEVRCRAPQDFDRPEDVKFRLMTDLDSKLAIKDSQRSPEKVQGRSSDMVGRMLDLSVRNSGGHLVFYFIFDSSASVGIKNFQTSLKFATALVRRVGISPTVHVGAVTYGKDARIDLFPLGTESQEIVLDKLSKIEYMGGGTATKDAMVEVLGMISTVRQKLNPSVIKSTVFLVTDGIYNIGGSPESVAKMIKKQGIEVYVIGLVGNQENANTKSMVDIASSPKHVFFAQGYETLEYLVDNLLNDSIDYSRCGISVRETAKGRIFGGKESTIHWPWMAHVDVEEAPGRKGRCGGSIIDNMWILTAAHCVHNVSVDRLNVTVGALNLTGVDTGARHHYLVEKIWIHQLYNRSTYDHDVALLKLKSPVDYGKYVRRICLPPEFTDIGKESSLYRTGEQASVIGFGLTSRFSRGGFSDRLKETEVFLQDTDTCKNSIKDHDALMTDTMICAGDPEGGRDACDGDSGGPLMQRLEEGLGMKEPYWVQTGVVSWGIDMKCGQRGYYGFYTHLAKVLPWVKAVVTAQHA